MKRVLSLILAVMMITGMFTSGLAEETMEPEATPEPEETEEMDETATAIPAAEEPISVTLPEGPYALGVSYPIEVSIPGATACTVTWASNGNAFRDAYEESLEVTLTDGKCSFGTISWYALTETITIQATVNGEKVSKSFELTYSSDTTGPSISFSAQEALVNGEVDITIDVGNAKELRLYMRHPDQQSYTYCGSYEINEPKTIKDKLYLENEPGTYSYACRVYSNGHWSDFGPVSTIKLISKGTIEAPELNGVPTEPWPIGKDLELSFMPVAQSKEYNVHVEDANGRWTPDLGGIYVTTPNKLAHVGLSGAALKAGTYSIRFRPIVEAGYTVIAKTYTFVVAGDLSSAPTVSAPDKGTTHSTISLTCTAEKTPSRWKVRWQWTNEYGAECHEEKNIDGVSATQVLQVDAPHVEGGTVCTVQVCTENDAVWSQYSQPVVVSFDVGTWEAPGSIRIKHSGSKVSNYFPHDPYTVVWGGVGYSMAGYEIYVRAADGQEDLLRKTVAPGKYGYGDYECEFDGFPATGTYTVGVRTLGDGVYGLDSLWNTLTVEVVTPLAIIESAELQGVPTKPWQAGRDLTLTFTAAEHVEEYRLALYQNNEEKFHRYFREKKGSYTIDGTWLPAGEYQLVFGPDQIEDGYHSPIENQKKYSLTVQGQLAAAPTVTLPSIQSTIDPENKVKLTCKASAAPKQWMVRRSVYKLVDGEYQHAQDYTDTYDGTAARQVIEAETARSAGKVTYEVCAKINGKWTQYSEPVTVMLAHSVTITVPDTLQVNDSGIVHAVMKGNKRTDRFWVDMVYPGGSSDRATAKFHQPVAEGDISITPTEAGEVRVQVAFTLNGYRYTSEEKRVTVTSIGKVAAPVVTAAQERVKTGEMVLFSWPSDENAAGALCQLFNPDGSYTFPSFTELEAAVFIADQQGTYRLKVQLVGKPGYENSDWVECTLVSNKN